MDTQAGRTGSGQATKRGSGRVFRPGPRGSVLSLPLSPHPAAVCFLLARASVGSTLGPATPFPVPLHPPIPPRIPPSSPRPTIAPKETIEKKSQNLVGIGRRPCRTVLPQTRTPFSARCGPVARPLCQRSRQLTGSRQHSLQHCHGAWEADFQTALSRF